MHERPHGRGILALRLGTVRNVLHIDIDFLDAQRAFRDTQRTYNRALFDYHVGRFELDASLGLSLDEP